MNCESWLEPKNSRTAATTGRMLISVIGRQVVGLADRHTLADDTLHPAQTDPQRVLDQFAHGLDAAVAQVVNIVRLFQRRC